MADINSEGIDWRCAKCRTPYGYEQEIEELKLVNNAMRATIMELEKIVNKYKQKMRTIDANYMRWLEEEGLLGDTISSDTEEV